MAFPAPARPQLARVWSQKDKFRDPDTIVENNFRVLLTRARKEMILLIPRHTILDETYQYFVHMGMDEL